ncbi:MAG TPA: ATP-binding protein [Candidatus Saccharimonadales bacterium]|jgi:two-component system phosphate regulon sensor histidine kinase PhoR|nr:ATP-binding protein [Candidatus Saccharimonadales bacterium]
MLFKLASYMPAVLGLLTIGLITFLKNARDELNIRFFLLVLILATWQFTLFLGDLAFSREFSLWALRLAACIGSLIIPALLYFSIDFPVRFYKPDWRFHFLTLGSALFFMVLALTPYLIPAINLQQLNAQPSQVGLFYALQTLYAVIGFLASFIIMLRKFWRVEPRQQAQIRLIMTSLLIGMTLNIVAGFILAMAERTDNYTNLAGGLSFVIFVAAASYAIIKHRLFDIRLAIARTVGFLVAITLVAALYSLIVLVVTVPLITRGKIEFIKNDLQQVLLFVLPTIFVALTFHSLQQLIARLTRAIFFQDSYDVRATLDKLSDTLISDNDINKIMSGSLKVISQAIKPSHALFVVLDDQNSVYRQQLINRSLPEDLDLLVELAGHSKHRVLIRDAMPVDPRLKRLENEDITLLLRLGTNKKLLGVLLFGPKQNGRVYTQQDIDLLNVSAKNLGVAIENAKKYEQIATFADTMRQEVLQATSSLRRANIELKTLDSLKDDFISMASHQLRGPATSVYQAIQILNQADISSFERRRLLELAEASGGRLIGVITGLLNVARIQAGRFDIKRSLVDLRQLADRAILEASGAAQKSNIKLQFNRPEQPIKLLADKSRLHESMSNYIENAIRYGKPDAAVVVTLKQTASRVYFEVTDTGIGVPKADRKYLFSKFYRATNVRQDHPNGNGLGLFVVKVVVQAHGGDTYFKPLKQGSLFGFWIPLE